MADIDQILAGGAGASSRATIPDFSGILDSFYKGRDQAYQQQGRDIFKNGVPQGPNGDDYGAMAKAIFQHGDVGQGVALSNLDLQQQNLAASREGANYDATGQSGGRPQQAQAHIISPTAARTNGVADPSIRPSNSGGQQAPDTSTTGTPGSATLAQVLTAQGIPNDQISGASASLARQIGLDDPTQAFDPQDQRIRGILVPAIQQMKRMGIGQVIPANAQAPAPQEIPPQQAQQGQPAPQAAPQAPSPFDNAVAAGLIPPGVDPLRYVAGLRYRAAALPKGPAQETIQAHVNAIDKATELTQSQRDYNASAANPKIDERATQQKADEATATARATSDVKEQDGIIADGRAAQTRLNTLNTVANIVQSDKNLTLGFGGETALKLKKALEQMGVNVGDLSGAQTIEKLNAALASEAAKSVSPRPAQFEFRTFLANNPGLSLDKAGNLRVLGIFSQLAKRDVDLGRKARANRDNWDNWDNVVQQYDKSHPILDPVTHTALSTDSVIAPNGGKASAPSLPALEPGKTVVNGHTYIGGPPNSKSSWELKS